MVSSISIIPILMMMLAGGTGNDLLDYVPTDAYFKAAKVEMSVPALTKLLEAAVPEGDARFGDSARRQMALRALGELGDAAALPVIAKYTGAKNALMADYARSARAAIEGKKYQRAGVSEDDLRTDLACLPSGVGAIGRIELAPGAPVDIIKQIAAMSPAGDDGQRDLEQVEAQVLAVLGGVIARLGNLRVGALTFGLAAEVGPGAGFVVVFARGLYDHEALSAMLGDRIGGVRRKAGGLTYHELESNHVFVAPVSDELLVFIAGAAIDTLPLAEVGAKVVAGGGDFAIGKTLAKLLDKADRAAPLWALVEVTEAYKEAPFLKPFDTLVIQGLEAGGNFKLSVVAQGGDPAAAAEVVDELNAGLEKMREQFDESADAFPGAPMVVEALKSAAFTAGGTSAKFEVELPGGGGGTAALLPMMWFGMNTPMEAKEMVGPDEEGKAVEALEDKAPEDAAVEPEVRQRRPELLPRVETE